MNILFIAPVDIKSFGYGNASYGIYQVLEQMKLDKLIDNFSVVNITGNRINVQDQSVFNTQYDVALCVAHPNTFIGNPSFTSNIYNIIKLAKKKYLSIVWETDKFPSKWNTFLNDNPFDGYLAPSIFIHDLLKKVSNKPIFYYPHHININDFTSIDLEIKKKEEKFTVLFVGQYTARKGVNEAVIGFTRALGYCSDAEMILKIHRLSNIEIDPSYYYKTVIPTNCDSMQAKIHLLDQVLDLNQMNDLYQHSSVLLFCSRGEGFGLPGAEAMACGLPVLYTNWSSCPEVCKSTVNIPLEYMEEDAHSMANYSYEKGLKYATPKISSIVQNLENLYTKWKLNKEEYYIKSLTNREVIYSRFGYPKISRYIMDIIEDKPFVKNKIVLENIKKEESKTEEVGKIVKDSLGYLWSIRNSELVNHVYQDEVGSNIDHESEILVKIFELIDKDTIFIDIGSHVGYYAIRLSDKVKEVLAFEPDPINYNGLIINKFLNSSKNLNTYPVGIGSEKIVATISHLGGESTIINEKNKDYLNIANSVKYNIQILTLDEVLKNLPDSDKLFIKIDTEGFEVEILKGSKNILKRNNIIWLIEYHEDVYDYCKGHKQYILDIMKQNDYKILFDFSDQKKIIFSR